MVWLQGGAILAPIGSDGPADGGKYFVFARHEKQARENIDDEGVVQTPIWSMPYKVTQHCRLSVALQPFDQS